MKSFLLAHLAVAAGDSCSKLCESYSVHRLGRGEDLCSGPVSTCNTQNFCTFLYWSESEDGNRGLIYSEDGFDLMPEELARPINCDDAFELYDISSITTGLQVFVRLPPVTSLLRNQDLIALARQSNRPEARVFQILRDLMEGSTDPVRLVHSYRRATNGFFPESLHGVFAQPAIQLKNFVTQVGRLELLEGFSIPGMNQQPIMERHFLELNLQPHVDHWSSEELFRLTQAGSQWNDSTEDPSLFFAYVNRGGSRASIEIERRLDLSQLFGRQSEALVFSLVALIHLDIDGTYYAQVARSNGWQIVRDGRVEETNREPDIVSRSAVAMIYRRQRRRRLVGIGFSSV